MIVKKDLEEGREILIQALRQSPSLEPSLLHRVYWGLMIAEQQLSGYKFPHLEDNILHINEAERWRLKLVSERLRLDIGQQILLNLEQYIIQGRKASLELKREPGLVEASRSKNDAIKGIDSMLEEMKEKDPTKYHENKGNALGWRTRFVSASS